MFKRVDVVVGHVKILPVSLRTSNIPYPVCISLDFPTFLIENLLRCKIQKVFLVNKSKSGVENQFNWLKFFLENNSYFYKPMFLRANIFEINEAVHTTYNHKNL